MKSQLVAALAVAGLAVTACGTSPSDPPAPSRDSARRLDAANVVMARPAAHLDYASLASGNRQLGFALAQALAAGEPGQDLVYSPTSLAIAFAMLREGARGRTAARIDQVLHLPADRRTAYNGLVQELRNPGRGNQLDIGNGLFIDPGLTVRRDYLVALKRWYDAGVVQTPFPSPALDVINSYVDENTHGRIPRLIEQLDPSSVFALINTVYLNAKWQSQFDPAETMDADFTTPAKSSVTVHMMHSTDRIDYASGADWQAVRLPYRGDRLSMWVLLPDGDQDPGDLLSPSTLAAADQGFHAAKVDLRIPRWKIDYRMDLTETLQQIGLDIFGSGDFSGLTPDPAFAVAQVLQQANITVGEKGTIAAAATAIVGETAAQLPPQTKVAFTADHPFAFAIMDNATGTPLFEGTVSDPS